MTRRCQGCSHNVAETSVPMPLCRRCACAFYAGLLDAARLCRLIHTIPSRQGVEQARRIEIAELASALNAAFQQDSSRRGPKHHYDVNFLRGRYAA